MKIYCVTDYNIPCAYTCTGWGVEGLSKYIPNAEVKMMSYDQMKARELTPDSGHDVFFFFEIGNPQHCGVTTADLRKLYPNGKLIAFCSDTIYYQMNGGRLQMEPNGIDLHLEVMPQSVEWLRNQGIATELWMWTLSDKLLGQALGYRLLHSYEKIYNFIGVYHPCTIDNPECWRHHAINYIREHGYRFTNGGGNGHGDTDLGRLFTHYMQSFFTLGTTSHNRPELTRLGCMKGFRDWLGPVLGSLLIYDNHPNVMNTFNQRGIVPIYEYDNLESIIHLHKELYGHHVYSMYMARQLNWIRDNTIDKQLVNIMKAKGWINESV